MELSPVAIVTGAAGGIGCATTVALTESGYRVGMIDIDKTALDAAASRQTGEVLPVTADVSDEAAVRDAVSQIADALGAPTGLVNNAGLLRDNLLFKMSGSDWDDVMEVHLRGAFLMARETQQHMREAGHGRIVNISSIAALGNRGQVNYSAAKAGLQGLTKTLAVELGQFGITANAVAPGFIETAMTRATAARMRMEFDELKTAAEAQIPLGRIGRPDDVADVIAFLLSDAARYVSGQTIYVAGGPCD